MSKLFKIIVNIIIVICILSVVALIVPPFVGIAESISEPQMDTNIPEGTVVYGQKLPVSMTAAGDEIIYEGDGYLYLYKINEIDSVNGEVHVVNEVSGEQSVLQISKNVIKKALAVPYIGYIMIAARTREGLAMLISAAVVLVMLALVAELWRKKTVGDDDEEYAEEEEYFNDIARDMETETAYEETYNAGAVSAAAAAGAVSVNAAAQQAGQETASAYETSDTFSGSAAADAGTADGKTIIIPAKLDEMKEEAEAGAEAELLQAEQAAENKAGTPAEDMAASFADAMKHAEAEPEEGIHPADLVQETGAAETAAQAAEQEAQTAEQAATAAEQETPAAEQAAPAAEQSGQPWSGKQDELYDSDYIDDAFENVPEDRSAASLNMSDERIPDVSNALVAALASTQVSRSEHYYQQARQPEPAPVEEPPADEIELAMPVLSAEEIIDAAYARGEDPSVTRDEVTGVTLVDFSDCLN